MSKITRMKTGFNRRATLRVEGVVERTIRIVILPPCLANNKIALDFRTITFFFLSLSHAGGNHRRIVARFPRETERQTQITEK